MSDNTSGTLNPYFTYITLFHSIDKLQLNIGAKQYIPKNRPQNQMQGNPYMPYDMNNPYAQNMYYGNYYNYNQPYYGQGMGMGQQNYQGMGMMGQAYPQQNFQYQQPPQQYQPQTQQQPAQQPKPTGGIVGLDPKKNKKKKGQQQQQQQQPETPAVKAPTTTTNVKPQNKQNSGNQQQQQQQQPKQQQQQQQQQQQPKKQKQPEQKKTDSGSQAKTDSGSQKAKQQHKAEQTQAEKTAKETEQMSLEKKELIEDTFEGQMIEVDTKRQPVSIVFVGHVDAGKSTISGSLLYKLGQVDERTIEKYQREAKVHNRESWFMAYIMDINEEEKEKGKTVEIGKAFFETETKRFTLLDAPGHAGYIPNLLQGACQADFAGLVIAAKKGEFEAGFERTGSTREHTLLLKALGVNQLIVIVNKMDEETVKWSQERYESIQAQLKPFLKSCGFNVEKNVHWIPISGLNGDNLIKKIDSHKCPWYTGPTLIELLDSIEAPKRNDTGPVRLSVLDRYKEKNLYIMGKLENGVLKHGETYTLMPNKLKIEVDWLFDTEERGVPYAKPGESVRIRCKGLDNENEVTRGNVLCSNDDLCAIFNVFEAEIQVLELQEQQIIANGFKCILHFHTYIEECTIDIKCEIDRQKKTEKKVKFVRSQARIKAFVKTNNPLCGEKYERFPQLGRFSMRFEGMTIAIGKILKYKPYTK